MCWWFATFGEFQAGDVLVFHKMYFLERVVQYKFAKIAFFRTLSFIPGHAAGWECTDYGRIVANRAFLMPQIKNGAFFEPLGHFFEDKKMPHAFGHFWAFFQDSGKKTAKTTFFLNFFQNEKLFWKKKMLTLFSTNDKGDQIIPFRPFPSALIISYSSSSLSWRAAAGSGRRGGQ